MTPKLSLKIKVAPICSWLRSLSIVRTHKTSCIHKLSVMYAVSAELKAAVR
ncbi:hypothetical protein Plhal304r1_c017g0062151 [Plasmopara halstedii]